MTPEAREWFSKRISIGGVPVRKYYYGGEQLVFDFYYEVPVV